MTKTKEELEALKKDYKDLSVKLKELTDEELKYVIGGIGLDIKSADYDEKEKPDPHPLAA